jgi:hypothetical protein
MNKKLITILIFISLILPSFNLSAEQGMPQLPETIEGAKEMAGEALKTGQKELPGTMKKIWQEEVLPVWNKMFDWFKVNVWPKAENEIKKREPALKQDLQTETGEMKEDIKKEAPKVSENLKNLWKEFKNLIK